MTIDPKTLEPRAQPSFRRDDRGGVAIWFCIMLVPLILCAGTGLDLARSINQQAQIQGAVDAAALAGASAYTSGAATGAGSAVAAIVVATTYMQNFKTSSGLSSLTFSVTPGTATSGASVKMYSMTVAASSTIQNTLMKMTRASNTVTNSATAQNPVYNIQLSAVKANFSALDLNTISYYIVPQDGSVPTVTYPLFSNASGASTASPAPISVTASQQIGFMLTNVTNGNATSTRSCGWQWTWSGYQYVCTTSSNGYGSNQYGGTTGQTHYFYSHMYPPSKIAYPSVTQNCSLKVVINSSTAPSTGCTSSLSPQSAVNCVQASGQTMYFWWNDMGGTTDDKDFNDASYQVTCSQVATGVSKGLVLTN